MNIAPLSFNNYAAVQPNFNGKVIARGNAWTNGLKEAFENNEVLNSVVERLDRNICGRLFVRTQKKNTMYRHKGSKIYKIGFSLEKENTSFLGKVFSEARILFGKALTRHYHTEISTIDIMGKMSKEHVQDRLGVNNLGIV